MSVISEEELREIVEVVWMTVLDSQLEYAKVLESSEASLSAQISITGAWNGVVEVRASEDFLSHAASIMFSCSLAEVSAIDRTDTLTELTNMLGGTVKCLLPETCDLALPQISTQSSEESADVEWLGFCCEGKPLAVSVTENAENTHKAA